MPTASHITRAVLCLATAVIMAAPAWAMMPPKKYDHPYAGHLPAHRVPYGKAWATCDKIMMRRFGRHYDRGSMMISNRHLYGCTISERDGSKPEIVYSYDPSGRDPHMESNTFRHERAHANGWPAHHPNALP